MKKTLAYIRPYSGGLTLGLVTKTVGSAAELVLPYILSYIIDDLTPLKDSGRIYLMGGLMLFFALVALGGNIWANRLSAKVAGNMTHDIRYDLFRKTSYLKCSQVDEVTMPSLISRLTSDTYYVNQMVARTMRMGVRAPILLLGGLVFCFLLNVQLALVLLAVVPIVAVPLYLITRKSVPMYMTVQKSGDNMVRSVQEDITGIRVIKALSKTEYENKKFEKVAGDLASTEFRAQRIMSLTNPLTSLILNLGLSGGQKQRLLVARALAGEPEIIVLDDSSSALDYATDSKLRRALTREYASSTKVIVAQRVSSVKGCDLIMVLDDGRVSGMGTHEELMKNCGEYRAIAETQMGVAE